MAKSEYNEDKSGPNPRSSRFLPAHTIAKKKGVDSLNPMNQSIRIR
jgi:hypothetical protein